MTSADRSGYELLGLPQFDQDLRLLRAQAKADPSRYLHLYREVLKLIGDLRAGASDGHHALGYESGKGDLRDCVAAYVQSDPQQRPDHRLVFREIGPADHNSRPRRELLGVRPRNGAGAVYEHVCARLRRHPRDRQSGLNRFGDRAPGDRGNAQQRQAELDTKRAIAHAWAGQRPLASSRPLAGGADRARPTTDVAARGRRRDGAVRGGTGWPPRP